MLDVGCGDGLIGSALSAVSKYAGCDIDVSLTSERFEDLNLFNLEEDLEIQECDIILMLDVLEHIEEDEVYEFFSKYLPYTKKLIINIPYVSKKEQIIDRNVDHVHTISLAREFGFTLKFFEEWSVNKKERYRYMVLEK